MSQPRPAAPSSERRIGKQIKLPWTKAVEIAAKSIQVRFWRSMITMSSIVLAIAFLMSIWTSTAIVAALGSGPAEDLADVQARLDSLRQATSQAERQAVLDELDADLARATRHVQDALAEKKAQLQDTEGDAKAELDEAIAELQTLLQPDHGAELVLHYLTDRRDALQRRKGDLDTILQRERAGQTRAEEPETPDEESPSPAADTARAGAGGVVTDFLSQMTPTDKWLATLALLVCFVGIVNAMFMTVQERFREIGTMKCLGALDAFIVKIFLIESAALGLIGTLVGIGIGLLLSVIRQLFVYGWPVFTYFPEVNVLVAALLAALVGLVLSVVAAIFPARRAARMEPVEAMRIEE